MKSLRGFIAAGLLFTGLLAGCGGKEDNQSAVTGSGSPAPVASSAAQAAESGTGQKAAWPRTYKDGLGKEVVIEKQPQKIAVLHFGYVEYLLALGVDPYAAAQLSTVEKFKTLKPYPQMGSIIDVGQVMSPNLEKLVELQPDLIIAGTGIHDKAYDSLSKISTVVYKKNYGSWKETLNDYAQLLGKEAEAESLVQKTEQVIKETREKLAKYQDKTFVFLRPSSKGAFGVVGSKVYIHYHDKENGFGLKTPANYPENWADISLETLSEMNPDYIFFQDDVNNCKALVDTMSANSVWKSISAVRDGNIHYLDLSLNTASPLAIQLAAEEIVKSLEK